MTSDEVFNLQILRWVLTLFTLVAIAMIGLTGAVAAYMVSARNELRKIRALLEKR